LILSKAWNFSTGEVCPFGMHAKGERMERQRGAAATPEPLTEALDLQLSAARVGFDWPDVRGAVLKLREEVDELDRAIAEGERDAIESELGDVIFSAVNVSRFVSVEPGSALRGSSRKFASRFASVGEELERRGRRFEDCSLEELDSVWDALKSREMQERGQIG
jgi:ATP diphosphatase